MPTATSTPLSFMFPFCSLFPTHFMATNTETISRTHRLQNPPYLSNAGQLQRAMSDISFEMSDLSFEHNKESMNVAKLPQNPENTNCQCCGMSEYYTAEYICHVRDSFFGKMICGLCAEAVKEEMEKSGEKREKALAVHTSMHTSFNTMGRVHPVLGQAEAMKVMLKKLGRAKSYSPGDVEAGKKKGIVRSSSCIPAMTEVVTGKSEEQKTAGGLS